MRQAILAAFILAAMPYQATADNQTRGYVRSDGTYVAPHYKSEPNQYRNDNYSAQGNRNPYTGQQGSQRHEYTTPPAYNKNYGNPNYGSQGRLK
jgi:hypothetical protein